MEMPRNVDLKHLVLCELDEDRQTITTVWENGYERWEGGGV